MVIVDGHMHVLDRSWVPKGVRVAWARQAAGRRFPERDPKDIEPHVMTRQSDPTARLTIAAFDKCGVAGGVIPNVDWTLAAGRDPQDMPIDEVHENYDRLFRETNHRLVYCAGIDPRHADARERAERMTRVEGCVGFKLYPATGWRLDDEQFQWLPDFAQENGVPMVIHTSPLGGDPLVTPYSRPAALSSTMARFPDATWVFAHGGFEAWWAEAIDLAAGWRSAYLDISLWQMLADRDYAEFHSRMALMIGRLGAHRVIFGSDIIRGEGEDEDGSRLQRWIDQVTALTEPFEGRKPAMTAADLELVIGANAIRVFRAEKWFT
jgi:predicted TIM-barrel fold metal-dependent hydrolase